MASKNADLLYFGGPWTDYQCHSETTSNQPHYQFEVQLLGLGPCGFPSFLDFDVQYEVLQARSHNEANEAVASPKISKKNLPQMKNS